MKKLILLLNLFFLFIPCFSQITTDIIDLLIASYDFSYLSNSIVPSDHSDCPPQPEYFYEDFDTYKIDFKFQQYNGANPFSFNDSVCMPLKKMIYITSFYGDEIKRVTKHFGIDFRLDIGDTIFSVFCGKVRIAKWDETYGNVVVVRHYNMGETVYAHLDTILVNINQEVKCGDAVGLGGNTGRSTGPHLHFELRYKGFPINPIVDNKFLKQIPMLIHKSE